MDKKSFVKIILIVIFGLSVSIFVGGKGSIQLIFENFTLLSIFGMAALTFITWNINCYRTRLVLNNKLPLYTQDVAFRIMLSTEFATKLSPGGIAGPITAAYLMRKIGLKTGSTLSLAIIIIVFDIIIVAFGVFIILALKIFDFETIGLMDINYYLIGMILIILSAMLILKSMKYAPRIIARLYLSLVDKNTIKVFRQLIYFKHGIKIFNSMGAIEFSYYITTTIIFWVLQLSVLYIALVLLGITASWYEIAMIQVLSMVVGRITFIPGGAGSVEITAILLLSQNIDQHIATSAVILWRSMTLYLSIIIGGFLFSQFLKNEV